MEEFINNIYLPKNYMKNKYKEVYWDKKYGYIYKNNNVNKRNIKKLQDTVNNINVIYDNYELDYKNTSNNNYGIIGIDIKYIEPKWVSDIIIGYNKLNPIITKYNEIIFSKSRIDIITIELSIEYLKKKTNKFNNINPYVIYVIETSRINNNIDIFIASSYEISIISYDDHTRIIFKKDKFLYILDPWKKTIDKGTRNLMKNYKIKFIKRKKEQSIEGSCTAISFVRSLQMADKGIDKINLKINYILKLFHQNLLSYVL